MDPEQKVTTLVIGDGGSVHLVLLVTFLFVEAGNKGSVHAG